MHRVGSRGMADGEMMDGRRGRRWRACIGGDSRACVAHEVRVGIGDRGECRHGRQQ